MTSPSGFFVTPTAKPAPDTGEVEVLYTSEGGHSLLLRGRSNDRIVVYKTLQEAYRDDPVWQRILRREYEIGASLKHPGICEIIDWVRLPGYGDAIEMEWINGVPLDRWLAAHPADQTRRHRILLDLCDALSYLHRKQVIHRDLKPENILITQQGAYPKILDFGLSDTDSILTGKDPAGTLQYAAPEVIRGEEGNARSDIYSLGRIIGQMGPAFQRVARRCTAEDPDKRYASAEDLRRDLEKSRHARILAGITGAAGFGLLLLLGFLALRPDPVQQLFEESAGQVRQAATGSK